MRSELITGNLLLRHGFWFSGRSGYRLGLPVAEGQFGLAWESKTGLFLDLKEAHKEAVPEEDPPKLLHRLDHVKTLETLQQVYEIFTGQPLIKVSDELYKQQVRSRREQDPEELGMEIYREKFDSPVRRDSPPGTAGWKPGFSVNMIPRTRKILCCFPGMKLRV